MRRLDSCAARSLSAMLLAAFAAAGTAPAAFISSSSQVAGPGSGVGLNGAFYDRNDPPGTIVNSAVADSIIASNPVTATFTATLVDYPNGSVDSLFLPQVSALLGADAASLSVAGAGTSDASPSVWRLRGFIQIDSSFDTEPGNSTIDVTFALGSDDGSRLRIGGQTVIEVGTGVNFPGVTGLAEFESPGLYPLEIVWYDQFGGIGLEFSSSIPGGPNSGGPTGTVGIVPQSVLFRNASGTNPASVPAPTTAVLAAIGGLGLLGRTGLKRVRACRKAT